MGGFRVPYSPRLYLFAKIAYSEQNKHIPHKKKLKKYAIFPECIYRLAEKYHTCNKVIDYNFMGDCFMSSVDIMRGNQRTERTGFKNRRWVVDFARKNFTSRSVFINTGPKYFL